MTRELSIGLSYDDVLLAPGYSDFTRDDISIAAPLTREIILGLPLVSSPMDTVTDDTLAAALAREGGIGVLHRNMRVHTQAEQVTAVKRLGFLAAAATGVGEGYKERVTALVDAGADVLCIDSAHGYTKPTIEAVQATKRNYPKLQIIAGSVATYEGATALIDAGADALRVGMGPASICTTRIVSGMGVPQLTAVFNTARAGQEHGVPIIADGGIKYSGDMVKALAAGASTIMLGALFAATEESPGEVIEVMREHVPAQFSTVLSDGALTYRFKRYRGMGSEGAMKTGAGVNAEDEFHGKAYTGQTMVAEGVEGLVPVRGTVHEVCAQAVGGIRSGMYYVGARTIPALQGNPKFIQITPAAQYESHAHSIAITNPGKSYQ